MDEVMTEAETKIASNPNYVNGTVYGIIGAIVGAFVWKGITMATGNMYGLVALIIAALAGASFGFPTRGGDKKLRMIIGALLGLASIILGYYLIYSTAFDIGMGAAIVPADLMPFEEFWSLIAEPVDYIFLFIGVYEGAKLGSIE
ncbi:MAG: hypothetical protein OIN89_09475 [Candidatus Methanoperedens sp.]|jgi:uncharacterized membrane protein|nr:hypothetical protein [Candidatus Methanoperedens sp.]PKL52769.1 MAG: hypothetical protein CVV36_10695 [Candidatus Methanoperedenaceae archaeon HGW-Methanoperedenaceae-1]